MKDTEILKIIAKHLMLCTYETSLTGDETVQCVKVAGLSTGQPDFELLKDWLDKNCYIPKQCGKKISHVIFDEIKDAPEFVKKTLNINKKETEE